VHEADDSIVQARLLRESTRVRTQMEVTRMTQVLDLGFRVELRLRVEGANTDGRDEDSPGMPRIVGLFY
jgi:hypothetical protein